jgi:hypothetical protein
LLVRFLKTIAKNLAEVGEFGFISVGAQSSDNFLPVLDVGIVYDIPQILSDNAGEQANVLWTVAL